MKLKQQEQKLWELESLTQEKEDKNEKQLLHK